ncbi:mucosal pentraxin-like [Varanus komodoensis]|uniref:Pentraxin (PTX) domain-containing protein n=1 Tax=Varanus komodoensis TaxID=61221 RepID=A0A8D2KUL1_VARKO|nr:mucosal pentraxin-like [Varanus komodoensis]
MNRLKYRLPPLPDDVFPNLCQAYSPAGLGFASLHFKQQKGGRGEGLGVWFSLLHWSLLACRSHKMERAALWSLVLLSFSGALAKTNLNEKVFVFPKTSADAYVLLKPRLSWPLSQFTLCIRYFTDLTRSYSIFSASSRQHDNEILLIKHPAEYHACVGGQCQVFIRKANPSSGNGWTSACLTWASATGITELWLDGEPLPRKGAAKGHNIPTELVVMLGQEQDSFGGSLDAQQSFVGEISDVFLWDAVLPPEQLRSKDTTTTALVSWTMLDFEIKGYVVIEPTIQ